MIIKKLQTNASEANEWYEYNKIRLGQESSLKSTAILNKIL